MKKFVIAAALGMLGASSFAATEHIVNGTFNDNVFGYSVGQTGWSTSLDLDSFFYLHTYAQYSAGSNTAYITQNVLGALGSQRLSFDYMGPRYSTELLNPAFVAFNGIALGTLDFVVPGTPFRHYSYNVTGTGNDILTIHFPNGYDRNYLMNVSLTSAVPEPETVGMLLAGLGLLGFTARRKAVKKTAA
ncbi:hypothetical protein GCM10022212_27440 [Actimicrobium antarcticum]|uniref:Ice-binding protein C-terminal domain-containing protein n=1 Tax=Actimicrobium antarcticum TaxID=1051899 RepID=A0ABP7TKU3_9BURK